MDKNDVVVVDSFQALTTKTKMNSRALEQYAISDSVQQSEGQRVCVDLHHALDEEWSVKGIDSGTSLSGRQYDDQSRYGER
jgi:hypothetical protein